MMMALASLSIRHQTNSTRNKIVAPFLSLVLNNCFMNELYEWLSTYFSDGEILQIFEKIPKSNTLVKNMFVPHQLGSLFLLLPRRKEDFKIK